MPASSVECLVQRLQAMPDIIEGTHSYCLCFNLTLCVTCTGWINATSVSPAPVKSMSLVKLEANKVGDYQICFSIKINEDRSWIVNIMGITQKPSHLTIFAGHSQIISSIADLKAVVDRMNQSLICCGNSDEKCEKLISSRKGIFMNQSGKWNWVVNILL